MIQVANGLQLLSVSKDVQFLFDQALSEFLGWFGNPISTLNEIIKKDPNIIMAHVLLLAFDLLGTAIPLNSPIITERVAHIKGLLKTVHHSHQEYMHAKAMFAWADGRHDLSGEIYEQILLQQPKDILALKIAQDSYFYLGNTQQLYQSVHDVVHHYDDPSVPDKEASSIQDALERKQMFTRGFVLGMYSFGLEETGRYQEAETAARRGLYINKLDAWSTHGCAHVMEMQGRQEEGIKFLLESKKDWSKATALACHLNWHLSLYYIEKGNFEEAIRIYDNDISKSVESEAMLDLVDGASLLYRLLLENKLSRNDDRWKKLQSIYGPHLKSHVLVFNDVHIAMCYDVHSDEFSEFLKSWNQYLQSRRHDSIDINNKVANEIGALIIDSILAYGEQKYERVYENLHESAVGFNGSKVARIGGSHAQRDVLAQLLLGAMVRTPKQNNIVMQLLQQRKNEKPNSGVTDRLIQKAVENA
ncbi:tetratricopeptide repeat protein [Acrasis kona]|uniref:Tetratricopeptide repeat protein 38 n=1 Tax=Acrasis kona TaxID=1008807 RepID=A0AAW2Z5S0_9EUKA